MRFFCRWIDYVFTFTLIGGIVNLILWFVQGKTLGGMITGISVVSDHWKKLTSHQKRWRVFSYAPLCLVLAFIVFALIVLINGGRTPVAMIWFAPHTIIQVWNMIDIFFATPTWIEKLLKTKRIQEREPKRRIIFIFVLVFFSLPNITKIIKENSPTISQPQPAGTSILDTMTEEERYDYLESLGFSTPRSQERSNMDPNNQYALVYNEKGEINVVDKCEDMKYNLPIDRSLCKKSYPSNTISYSNYGSYTSNPLYFRSYSSDDECIEPENPYDEFNEEWHYAGFERAERTGGICDGNSDSFNEWCEEYYYQEELFAECEDRQ